MAESIELCLFSFLLWEEHLQAWSFVSKSERVLILCFSSFKIVIRGIKMEIYLFVYSGIYPLHMYGRDRGLQSRMYVQPRDPAGSFEVSQTAGPMHDFV